MTYETSNKDATESIKSGIWTHTLSQEPEIESGPLDRSAILTLYQERQYLLYMLFISHIDLRYAFAHVDVLYSIAHFECNLNIFDISYAPWCRIFP